jgi:hypothetical protein
MYRLFALLEIFNPATICGSKNTKTLKFKGNVAMDVTGPCPRLTSS